MREIAQDKSYLNKLVGSRLFPQQAEKYGVNVKDPDGLKKRLDELSALYERWKNPALHLDLMEEMCPAFEEVNAGQGWLDIGRGGCSGGSSCSLAGASCEFQFGNGGRLQS